MNQFKHIFRKDLRRHWPEILFSFAAVAVFAWHEARSWSRGLIPEPQFLNIAINILPILSWWVLAVRVIQSEPLAGDRQFWITRPYDWKQLLLEKAAFVVIFVEVPLLASHVFLLIKAGFSPLQLLVPGTAFSQLELIALLLLPIAALATVTESFGQMVLALLGVCVYIAGLAAISDHIPSEGFASGSEDLQGAVLICICGVIVLIQYARRNTILSRLLAVSSAVLILIIMVATPYGMLAAHEYPDRGAEPAAVRLTASTAKPPKPEIVPDDKDEVEIRLPILVSGIQEGSYAEVEGTLLSLKANGDQEWNSGWKGSRELLVPRERLLFLTFEIKKKFYEQVKSGDVNAQLSVALKLFKDANVHRLLSRDSDITVPGVGLCSISKPYYDAVNCRYAVEGPSEAILKVKTSEITCPERDEKAGATGATTYASGGSDEAGPFSPVGTFSLGLWRSSGGISRQLCPGTPFEISLPELLQRTRQEIVFNKIKLDEYRVSNVVRFSINP